MLGGVGLSGVAATSGNGIVADANVYPLVEVTVEFLRESLVDDGRSKDLNVNVN